MNSAWRIACVAIASAAVTAPRAEAESGVATVSKSGGKQPHAAVAPDGRAYVVWASGSAIECAVAPKVGDAFGDPVKVGDVGGLMAGMRRGPRVAATAKAAVATGIGKDGSLVAFRSEDGGATWTGPVTINGASGAAREGMSDLAAGAKGTFHAVWLDDREGKKQVWAAVSADDGKSWTETKVYQSPSGAVCECCSPSAAADGQGRVYAMFRNSLDGFRDMYMAVSPDGGKSWGKAMKLGTGSWKLNACPMAGGAVAAADGKPMSVWVRETGVYMSGPGGGEQSMGKGFAPWVAQGPDGTYAVWQSSREGGKVFLMRPRAGAAPLGPSGSYPVVGGDPKGGVVAAWEADGQIVAAPLRKAGK